MTSLLSYKSRVEADADRATQVTLLNALNAWESALRRDDCGAWRINGKRGHVFTWGDGQSWVLYIQAGSPRRWSNIKKQLAFCRVTQDGDDEGCLRLFGLPTAEQAKAIRDVLGIRKRRPASRYPSEWKRTRPQEGVSGQISADRGSGRLEAHPAPFRGNSAANSGPAEERV